MKFKIYYTSLNKSAREAFAARAGTSTNNIESHYLHLRRIPRRDRIEQLANASEGNCTYRDIVDHFYPSSKEESAGNDAA